MFGNVAAFRLPVICGRSHDERDSQGDQDEGRQMRQLRGFRQRREALIENRDQLESE